LDSLGCAIFGASLPWTRSVRALAEAEDAAPVASIVGSGRKTSVALAVLVNATACHAYELDDIHKESILHPGSLAVPVAFALGEARRACSGRDLLTAIVVGYEVGTRVGNAATMSLFLRGFHPQGTSGVFVAAATAGRMLGLDERQMHHALGMAGSQAGGLMAAQEGAMVKRFHSGRAAQGGVYAAQLALHALTGIDNVLEAPYGGFLSSFSDDPHPRRLTEGLGTAWETLNVGYKPYAAVTSIHSALDALDAIMRTHALSAEDIARIDVGVSRMTHVHCAWEYRAQGVTAAQMNLFYGVAVMALERNAFVDQYREDRLALPATLSFMQRVAAHVDDDIDRMGPEFRHACRLYVRTTDGRELQLEALHRRGSPELPLTASDVERKFRSLVASRLTPEDADRMVELVGRLDETDDTTELTTLMGAQSHDE
jgi:2-methylcitrate dehydratase PrpD